MTSPKRQGKASGGEDETSRGTGRVEQTRLHGAKPPKRGRVYSETGLSDENHKV